jgi:hypothetical protein
MNKNYFQHGVFFIFGMGLCWCAWLISYRIGLGLLTAEAMANPIKWEEANSLLYMTSQEKEEYKLYILDGGMDAADFQFFDEWKEHRVFKLTLSDLQEPN